MSKQVKITKLGHATRKDMTKVTFQWEHYLDDGRRTSGEGRFACLAGNEQNWPGLIRDDLKRRLGSEITIQMPEARPMLGLKKAG